MDQFCLWLKNKYNVSLNTEGREALAERLSGVSNQSAMYNEVLNLNFLESCERNLPRDLGSQPTAQLDGQHLLQVVMARDVTQPLRPCADMTESEELWGAVTHGNSDKRLLKIIVTDGVLELPAVELSTLKCIQHIPVPGEKILIEPPLTVKQGTVLLQEGQVKLVGGYVEALAKEYEMQKKLRRAMKGVGISATKVRKTHAAAAQGVDDSGPPVFEPFKPSLHYTIPTQQYHSDPLDSHGGADHHSRQQHHGGRGGHHHGGGGRDHGPGHGHGHGNRHGPGSGHGHGGRGSGGHHGSSHGHGGHETHGHGAGGGRGGHGGGGRGDHGRGHGGGRGGGRGHGGGRVGGRGDYGGGRGGGSQYNRGGHSSGSHDWPAGGSGHNKPAGGFGFQAHDFPSL